jgi:hypothetical protein
MAKQQVLVSDLTGDPIAPGDEAKITVVQNGKRWELDVASAEVADLVSKGRETKRRGRPPKHA